MTFSEKLKYLKLKKKDLAERIDISPETISRWGDCPPTVVNLYLDLLIKIRRIGEK